MTNSSCNPRRPLPINYDDILQSSATRCVWGMQTEIYTARQRQLHHPQVPFLLFCFTVSKTHISDLCFRTNVARHFTAPVKYAVASFPRHVRHRPISPIATHQVTTIDANGRRVALPPSRALEADRIVSLAVVRRVLVVDQVSQARRLVVAVDGNKVEPPRTFPPLTSVHRIA